MPKLIARIAVAALLASVSMLPAAHAEPTAQTASDGIDKVRSAYRFAETVERLKADIAAKKIMVFLAVDQAKLAADAGIALRPSTLLMFGNPPLGTQFITSNPNAGLDWPVRLLVTQQDDGSVWTVYSDFGWIARRHGIKSRDAQFKMASQVIASITSSVAANSITSSVAAKK